MLKPLIAVALIALALGVSSCGEGEPEDRGVAAVAVCQDRGGVVAFDDEVVICRDQTSHQIE
jgi:hypothetical protein